MIPTTTRYAPNSPQTPARQTAPAAQRPAAQRQGFTLTALEEQSRIVLDGFRDDIYKELSAPIQAAREKGMSGEEKCWLLRRIDHYKVEIWKEYRKYEKINHELFRTWRGEPIVEESLRERVQSASPEYLPALNVFLQERQNATGSEESVESFQDLVFERWMYVNIIQLDLLSLYSNVKEFL